MDCWRAALRVAGGLLVSSGATTHDYTDQMIRSVEEHGPYIVIVPGLALAHARPSPAVLRTGLSWVGLATPVAFGHEHNDPVRLVIALAATDHGAHGGELARLARMLADPGRFAALKTASSAQRVRTLIAAYERDTGAAQAR